MVAYRLFERQRFDFDALFAPACRKLVERLSPDEPLVMMMDDALSSRRGRKVHGTGWKRDPLGPVFCSNFVWGAALPPDIDGRTGFVRNRPGKGNSH